MYYNEYIHTIMYGDMLSFSDICIFCIYQWQQSINKIKWYMEMQYNDIQIIIKQYGRTGIHSILYISIQVNVLANTF